MPKFTFIKTKMANGLTGDLQGQDVAESEEEHRD